MHDISWLLSVWITTKKTSRYGWTGPGRHSMLSTPPYDSSTYPPTLQETQPDTDPEDGSHFWGDNCEVPCFWTVFFLDDSTCPQASWENTAVCFCGAELSQHLLSQRIWPEGSCSFFTIPISPDCPSLIQFSDLRCIIPHSLLFKGNAKFFSTLFRVPAWLTRKKPPAHANFHLIKPGIPPIERLRKVSMQIVPVNHTAADLFETSYFHTVFANSGTLSALLTHRPVAGLQMARPAGQPSHMASCMCMWEGVLYVWVYVSFHETTVANWC